NKKRGSIRTSPILTEHIFYFIKESFLPARRFGCHFTISQLFLEKFFLFRIQFLRSPYVDVDKHIAFSVTVDTRKPFSGQTKNFSGLGSGVYFYFHFSC